MKKIIAFSLALTLLGAFTSCGKEEESQSSDSSSSQTVSEAPTDEVSESPTEPEASGNESSGLLVATVPADGPGSENSSGSDESKPPVGDGSPAKILCDQFKYITSDGNSHTTVDIAEALANSEILPFATATMEMSEGWINGFNEEINGFKSATFFGPMIGTIPFVGYIFELDKDADTDAFISNLNEKANLAWNVCTAADEKLCESEGNFVFFVMAPASFEETSE